MITDYLRVFQLVIDFGLVVLIFLVQLTIYPSFLYFKRDDLVRWHQKYTGRIAIIVAPLIIAQIIIALFYIFYNANIYTLVTVLLAMTAWLSTILQFIPIHKKISQNVHSEGDLNNLVKRNWVRVGIWTILFLWNLHQHI